MSNKIDEIKCRKMELWAKAGISFQSVEEQNQERNRDSEMVCEGDKSIIEGVGDYSAAAASASAPCSPFA